VVQQSETDSRVDDPLLHGIGLTDCRNSLFERLMNIERRSGRKCFVGLLDRQGRMHPDVARFAETMFYAGENLRSVPLPHQLEASLGYDLPAEDAMDGLLKVRRMIFIPVEDDNAGRLSDKVNVAEADMAADIVRRIYRFYGERFDPDKTIGIIVPYRNQIAMIRRRLAALGISALDRISIDTVERFQGSQRDVIIYSFTVHRRSQLAFLTANTFIENGRVIDRKLNVAVTRARRQMIITGNPALLGGNAVFASLMRACAWPESCNGREMVK
jgi:superfamily I DNA and/or RNA helicase